MRLSLASLSIVLLATDTFAKPTPARDEAVLIASDNDNSDCQIIDCLQLDAFAEPVKRSVIEARAATYEHTFGFAGPQTQTFTPNITGYHVFQVAGAAGPAGIGGRGAILNTTVYLTKNKVYTLVVGESPDTGYQAARCSAFHAGLAMDGLAKR